jgi:RNA polymerase sigma-70 factor, ECF subfamily
MDPRADDRATIAALRRGEHAAFTALVRLHQPAFLRLARAWVHDSASAAEVVQEAWLTALESLDRFEGRSTLRTWLYGVVLNVARAHGRARRRMVPMSALVAEETTDGPTVEPERFLADGRWAGHWSAFPTPFPSPDGAFEQERLRFQLEEAIARLPPVQQQVIVLCDVEGLTGRPGACAQQAANWARPCPRQQRLRALPTSPRLQRNPKRDRNMTNEKAQARARFSHPYASSVASTPPTELRGASCALRPLAQKYQTLELRCARTPVPVASRNAGQFRISSGIQ